MTIQIQEIGGSPREKYSLDAFTATRTFVLPWSQRDEFAKLFFGDRLYDCESFVPTQSETLTPTAVPELVLSAAAPSTNSRMQYPGKSGVYVVKIEFEPLDAESLDVVGISNPANVLGDYRSFAKATVTYSSETTSVDREGSPSVDSGTRLTYKMVVCGETISTPSRSWRWADKPDFPVADDLEIAKRVPTIEHQLVWSNVVNPPWERISATQGTVNDAEFLGYAAGTLLFEGAEANKIFDGSVEAGSVAYTWQIRFIFREKRVVSGANSFGWNDFYRESTGEWARLLDAAGEPLYRAANHSALFVQES